MEKDAAAILRSNIMALPVERGGIMRSPKHLQQLVKTDNFRVKSDLNRLRMTRGAFSDVVIGGIFNRSPNITGNNLLDPLDALKDGLRAPETSGGQSGGLLNFSHGRSSNRWAGWQLGRNLQCRLGTARQERNRNGQNKEMMKFHTTGLHLADDVS